MSKRRRIWITVALMATVLLAALLLFSRSSGPRYKGKTVGTWLDQLPRNAVISTNAEVSKMLTTLGSNAVPPLLAILNEESSWCVYMLSVLGRQRWLPAKLRAQAQTNLLASTSRAHNAVGALDFLGPKASFALPELERRASKFRDPNSAYVAFSAFAAVAKGVDTFPAVIRIATNTPVKYRWYVDAWLGTLLYRSHTELGLQAALALCELGSPPPEVIPPLAQCIQSRRSPHRRYVLQALGGLAPQYPAARDVLREASEDDEPEIRNLARSILNRQLTNNLSKSL